MNYYETTNSANPPRRSPWNEGKLIGPKPPLRLSHVWSIRAKLQIERRVRDLALFNLAIDSKLRGCDIVAVRVDDVAPNGYTLDRATIRQRKTGRPVRFELTELTRQSVDQYLRLTARKAGDFLFGGRGNSSGSLTTRQYARLVSAWISSIGLDPLKFGTHSLRRTKATLIYRRTGNLRAVQLLLGHTRSRAPFVTLASRSTMRLRLPRKLMSEISGQSGRALPACESVEKGQHRTLGCLQQRGCSLLLRRCIMLVQRCDHVANQFVDLSDVVASARANAEVSDDRASGRHDDQVLTHSAAREERVARRMRHVPGHSSFADIAVDDVGPEAGTIASVEGLRSRTRLAHLPFRQDAPIANDAVVNIEPAEAHPIAG